MFQQELSEDYSDTLHAAAARAYDDIDCMLVQLGHPVLADLGIAMPLARKLSPAKDGLMGVPMSVDNIS